MRIEPVVRGLIEGLLVDGEYPVPIDETVVALVHKINGMPGLMRFGMLVLVVCFDWYGLVRGGRRFQFQPLESKRTRIAEWAHAPVGPCRDMVEFFRKMGTFVSMSIEEAGHQ